MSDTVTARWLGGRVSIPALGLSEINHGDEVKDLPRGEAEASDNWEVLDSKAKAKKADQ